MPTLIIHQTDKNGARSFKKLFETHNIDIIPAMVSTGCKQWEDGIDILPIDDIFLAGGHSFENAAEVLSYAINEGKGIGCYDLHHFAMVRDSLGEKRRFVWADDSEVRESRFVDFYLAEYIPDLPKTLQPKPRQTVGDVLQADEHSYTALQLDHEIDDIDAESEVGQAIIELVSKARAFLASAEMTDAEHTFWVAVSNQINCYYYG